jgi:molybdate transport system ATP-binding protein
MRADRESSGERLVGGLKVLEASLQKRLPCYCLQLSLSCAPGETLMLVGPSGSGKTTVLRCLAGLSALDHGFIRYNGQCWEQAPTGRRLSPQARRIGLLSQNCLLFPHMRVEQNVRFAMERKQDVQELIEALGLGALAQRYPHELSGGERQRVALCQALARRPQLLLLDEPFSALDLENRRLLRALLNETQARLNLPIVQVTHDLREALASQAHILCLRNGREDQLWFRRQRRELVRDQFAWLEASKETRQATVCAR